MQLTIEHRRFYKIFFFIIACFLPFHSAFAGGGGECNLNSSSFQGTNCECSPYQATAQQKGILYLGLREHTDSGELFCSSQPTGKSTECISSADRLCASSWNDLFSSSASKYAKCDCVRSGFSATVGRPLCENSICQQCIQNSDCVTLLANTDNSFNRNRDSALCHAPIIAPNKYAKKKKVCHPCRQIAGSGHKKITFLVRGYDSQGTKVEFVKRLVGELLSKKPFAYLHQQNTFTFQVAETNVDSFVYFEKMIYQGNAVKWTDSTEGYIFNIANMICPGSEAVIFVDEAYPFSAAWEAYSVIAKSLTVSTDNGQAIAHEMGHLLCNLGDEYYIPDRFRFLTGIRHGINGDSSKNIDRSTCPKFKSLDKTISCLAINDPETTAEGQWFKSTDDSVMNNSMRPELDFNLVSCVSCLRKMSNFTTDAAAATKCRELGILK